MKHQHVGCGKKGDQDTICSPHGGTWTIGTAQNITWNPTHSIYVEMNKINITLSSIVKFQPKILKIWRDIPTKSGYLPVFLNDSFVPEILPAGGEPKAWEAFINISSIDASGKNKIFPPPSAFTLIEPAKPLQPSPSSSSSQAAWPSIQPSISFGGASQDNKSLLNNNDTGNYCLVAIAAVLAAGVVLCVILAGWCYIRPLKSRQQGPENNAPIEQPSAQFKEFSTVIGSEISGTSEGYRSSHYTQFSNVYSDDSIIPPSVPPTESTRLPARTARMLHRQPGNNMQPLSSADAVILGNMFLQKLRRPDWATDSQVTDQDNGEQSVFGNKLKKQLLKDPNPQSSRR
ncbi:hypothetical protein K450DRAFT_272188 [Umbelopsis ramanniana AG]|uniref:Uncharacterized protein n=1 Tax=Umbelopsis ramanniana AG TaxID=1314678 RepID=A0AAD5EA53_UMBRA|nr:uncharacterized protein K450DRAFT_272188 [Umbelopsis ramanniana AG]KAI8579176.1 hypothetical protein K450DRAFT_272188 [Umbelopsis ramanniana AG]